jgi:hypothetical protein
VDELARAYAVLGVRGGASAAEIKKRYRALVKVWHPDRFAADPQGQAEAATRMRAINEAYEITLAQVAPRTPAPAASAAPATAAGPLGGRRLSSSEIEGMRRDLGNKGLLDWLLGDPAKDFGWQAERRRSSAFGLSFVAAWAVFGLVGLRWPNHYLAALLVAFGTFLIGYLVLQRVLPWDL